MIYKSTACVIKQDDYVEADGYLEDVAQAVMSVFSGLDPRIPPSISTDSFKYLFLLS